MKGKIAILTGCLLLLSSASTTVGFFPIDAPGPLAEEVRVIVTAAGEGKDIEPMLWALTEKYCPCEELDKATGDEEVDQETAIPVPVPAPQVFNLEDLKAKTEVELSDYVPFFAEVTRQEWDNEITSAQADAKEEEVNKVIAGKHLLDTSGTIADVRYYEYSHTCTIELLAEYTISTGSRRADIYFDEIKLRAETQEVSADRCRSFNIDQRIVVVGEIEDSSGYRTTIINAVIK